MSKDPYARVETQQKAFKLYKLEMGMIISMIYAWPMIPGLSENKKDFCFFACITPVKEKKCCYHTHKTINR
jgi:hypothetical protein